MDISQKHKGTGHLNAKRQPMSNHENILVFGKSTINYNPRMTNGETYKLRGSHNVLNLMELHTMEVNLWQLVIQMVMIVQEIPINYSKI